MIKLFGKLKNGEETHLFTLENKKGSKLELTDYGATIVGFSYPDKKENFIDVILGYEDVSGYENNRGHLGATCGRVAGKVEDGRFVMDGVTYELSKNLDGDHMHGGINSLSTCIWEYSLIKDEKSSSVIFKHEDKDGSEGYPGNIKVSVIYTLTDDDVVKIEYKAESDKDTILNLTNHAYFNLDGHDDGNIKDHVLQLFCDKYTTLSEDGNTDGGLEEVLDTPLDFTKPAKIGDRISLPHIQIERGFGIDHCFVINEKSDDGELIKAAVLWGKDGRFMETYTTYPGIVVYTGNHMKGFKGKDGAVYEKQTAICLETEYFPNSAKHANFPSIVLRAGEIYNHVTEYRFS